MEKRRAVAPLDGAVVIIGYWRSGTTLLHELLCTDDRYSYPTTYACLNPDHFLLTQALALARQPGQFKRVQDRMVIGLSSPQEDEFALLCLGARSPYEAILAPQKFEEAFALADPNDLPDNEARYWRRSIEQFLRGVSLAGGGKPLILKSPTHSYRVAALRALLPDARFILIVRNPYEVFESMVRTFQVLSDKYGIGPPLAEDELRSAILKERLRFETKLQAGISGLPESRLAIVTYEALIRQPVAAIEALYQQLDLPSFDVVRSKLTAEAVKRQVYVQDALRPREPWLHRVTQEWTDVFQRYGYERLASSP